MSYAIPGKEIFLTPINNLIDGLAKIAPGAIWFIMIAAVGYLISALVGWIARKILYKINIDKRLRILDLHDSIGDISIAKLTGIILKWYIFILFLEQAVSYLSLGTISKFLEKLIGWMPALIFSIVIIIAGLILIDFTIHKLLELKNKYIKIIANILKGILIVVVIFTAIEQLGIKTAMAQNIFLMIIAAILVTFALAFGIGLGLSLKEEMKPIIKKYTKNLK